MPNTVICALKIKRKQDDSLALLKSKGRSGYEVPKRPFTASSSAETELSRRKMVIAFQKICQTRGHNVLQSLGETRKKAYRSIAFSNGQVTIGFWDRNYIRDFPKRRDVLKFQRCVEEP